jgi:nuclear pore complex protein Nup160
VGESEASVTEIIAVLYANIFKHSLALPQKRYEDAFNALLNNPDPSRQSDCLRRFVVVLCEDGQLERLCTLPFGALLEAVDRVLYDKASKLDVTHCNPNYYDVLFAFHTFRGNHRQAATIMVEYAQRLGLESHAGDLETLQRQANCYLAALNTFKFIPDPRDAWTVHVAVRPHFAESPKRKRDLQVVGNGRFASAQLLELRDMEREYWLIRSHLLLHKRTRSTHALKLNASETFALLIQQGCFDTALTLARLYDFPQRDVELVFDALTKRCLQLQLHLGDADLPFEEEWLDTLAEEFSDRSGSAWALLGNWLERYDGPATNYGLHTHVAEKVLLTDVRIRLPHWLVSRLQEAHPAALLRIYLHFDLVDDAALCAGKVLAEAARLNAVPRSKPPPPPPPPYLIYSPS